MTDSNTQASHGQKNPQLVEAFEASLAPIRTAFEDLNVVSRTTDLDIQSSSGTSKVRDVISTTNSGNVPESQPTGEILVESGTTSGSTASLETAAFGQYTPGYIAQQGIGIRSPTQPSGDAEITWGYYGPNDGFLWGYDTDGLYIARKRNGTIFGKTYRDNWNGVDPDELRVHDDPNFTAAEGAIFQIDFAWYGYGAIEFRIVSGIGGNKQQTATVHRESVSGETSITNPNQPITAEVDNGTTTNNTQVYVGGRQFAILGDPNPTFRHTTEQNLGASVADGSLTHLISLRRKSGDTRRANAEIYGAEILTDSDIRIVIIANPNIGSTTYGTPSLTNADETMLEASTAGSFNGLGNGVLVWEGFLSGQNNRSGGQKLQELKYEIARDRPATMLAEGIGGTATVDASLIMREEW